MEISVIMCSHNPRPDYLRRALNSLLNQSLPKDRWEFLLIDNASETPLAPDWDISWHPKARHIVESELGLSFARRCGMREAAADLLIFVDDDNVLEPDYLSEVLRIKHAWPMLGVWGSGAIVPEFEVQPAADVEKLVPYLALRTIPTARWSNFSPAGDVTPWGAGLCAFEQVSPRRIASLATGQTFKSPAAAGTSCSAGKTSR
jgi:glycosyltransferase involved in cell wall biosynthesis